MDPRFLRRGYTLVELLVAMVLSGIVIGFAFMLLQGSRGDFMRVSSSVELQSETREATRMLEHDLRNLGLRVSNMYSSRILSTVNCPHAYADPASGDSSSFLHSNKDSWADPGDEIVFAQYKADPSGSVTCAPSNLEVVRYRLRVSDSVLLRSSASQFSAISTANEVPICRSVVAFQLEYGLLGVDSTLWDTTSTWFGSVGALSQIHDTVVASGWSNAAILGFGAHAAKSIEKGCTYRFRMHLEPNKAFADTVERMGFGFWDGLNLRDTVTVWAGTSAGRTVTVDVEASQDLSWARPAVFARLRHPNSAASLAISKTRISQKTLVGYHWLSDPTVAQKKRVQAVKLSVITRTEREVKGNAPWAFSGVGDLPGLNLFGSDARKGYAFFQRIIPVVNHGM